MTLLLSACGGAAPHSWVRAVTTLTPRLCVGRYAATGECFTGGPPSQVASLRIGECVEVTFIPNSNDTPWRLRSIRRYPASQDRKDCPATPGG